MFNHCLNFPESNTFCYNLKKCTIYRFADISVKKEWYHGPVVFRKAIVENQVKYTSHHGKIKTFLVHKEHPFS